MPTCAMSTRLQKGIRSLRSVRYTPAEHCLSAASSVEKILSVVRYSEEQRKSFVQTRPEGLSRDEAKIVDTDLDDSALVAMRKRFDACADEPVSRGRFEGMLNDAANVRETALADVREQLARCEQLDGIEWRTTRAMKVRDERLAQKCSIAKGCSVGEFCSAEHKCVRPPAIQEPRQRGLDAPLELSRALNLDEEGFYLAGLNWGMSQAEWLDVLGPPRVNDEGNWTLKYDATLLGTPVELRARFGVSLFDAPDGDRSPKVRKTHTIHIRTTGDVASPDDWTAALRSRMGAPGRFWKKEHATMEAWNVIGVGQISLFSAGDRTMHVKLTRSHDKPGHNGFGPDAETYGRTPREASEFAGHLPVDVGPTEGSPGVKVLEDDGGLLAGDIIVEIDGVRIRSRATLDEALEGHKVSDRVRVALIRDGLRQQLEVRLHGHLAAGDSIRVGAPWKSGADR